jgi:hypothetical protein
MRGSYCNLAEGPGLYFLFKCYSQVSVSNIDLYNSGETEHNPSLLCHRLFSYIAFLAELVYIWHDFCIQRENGVL